MIGGTYEQVRMKTCGWNIREVEVLRTFGRCKYKERSYIYCMEVKGNAKEIKECRQMIRNTSASEF